jgi:hypothetical protein
VHWGRNHQAEKLSLVNNLDRGALGPQLSRFALFDARGSVVFPSFDIVTHDQNGG